ncbi:MAG: hypothetical protein UH850_04105 [Paludibacteraceae bacterium]|nr:hypothetical protein [Paludibacteraceae bacterium]
MERITFKQKPVDIPAEYRPMYQISLVIMILQFCCNNKSAILLKLHLFSWCLYSEENMNTMREFIKSKFKSQTPYWCIDPALNRALQYGVADNIFETETKTDQNIRYKLTDKGKLLAKKIEDDAELFVNEKDFLSKTGTKLKDTKITELTSRKLGL